MTSEDLTNILTELGLTDNEATLYLFLLRQGNQQAQHLPQTLSIDKSSCYRALKSLEKKEYIDIGGNKRNMTCVARPAETLRDKVRQQRSKLDKAEEAVDAFISGIGREHLDFFAANSIQVFSGEDAYKQWLEVRLLAARKNKTILEYISLDFEQKLFGADESYWHTYFTDYISRRCEANIELRSIVDKQLPSPLAFSSKKLKKEVRITHAMPTEGILSVYGDSIGYFLNTNNQWMGASIKDPALAKLHTAMFNLAWDSLPVSSTFEETQC